MHLVQPRQWENFTLKTNQPLNIWYEHSSVCLSAFHPFGLQRGNSNGSRNILVDIMGPNTIGTRCLKIHFFFSGKQQTRFKAVVTEFTGSCPVIRDEGMLASRFELFTLGEKANGKHMLRPRAGLGIVLMKKIRLLSCWKQTPECPVRNQSLHWLKFKIILTISMFRSYDLAIFWQIYGNNFSRENMT